MYLAQQLVLCYCLLKPETVDTYFKFELDLNRSWFCIQVQTDQYKNYEFKFELPIWVR